jgi:2-keto-4-pentenoate hydratase/2-oxohepta-3-ene-1,7-dioic acid hydratase in catechol pathway
MKLVRFLGGERAAIGALTAAGVVDLKTAVARYFASDGRIAFLEPLVQAALTDPRALLAAWPVVGPYIDDALTWDSDWSVVAKSLEDVDLLPFVANPGKVIGLGYNYKTLCEHEGVEPSPEPQLFTKMPTSIVGPYDDVVVPPRVSKVDFEAELCVIVGRTASRVTRENALDHVGGYTVMNDLTAKILPRPATEGETTTVVLKGVDHFAPIGAVVLTPDELSVDGASLVCRVNDVERQRFPVSDWVHDVSATIAYVAGLVTLHPGDMITMGTSIGLGILETPPRLLANGDVVECEIDGYPGSRNIIRLATAA